MSEKPLIKWARVEYQPNLSKPTEPMALGVIVTVVGRSAGAIIGMEPLDNETSGRPGSFGNIALAQLRGWVAAASREAQDAQRNGKDPFTALSTRWRWNLYVADAEVYETNASRIELWGIAVRLYKRVTGKDVVGRPTFVDRAPHRKTPGRRKEWQTTTDVYSTNPA